MCVFNLMTQIINFNEARVHSSFPTENYRMKPVWIVARRVDRCENLSLRFSEVVFGRH